MAQKTAEDVIYDKLIDTIQNAARDNDLRDEYDRFMGDRNYNNSDMTQLFEHCVKMVELGWEDCRNAREEDRLIADSVDESIAQHIGVWATSNKNIANAIDNDRVWNDLKDAAAEWDRVESDYDRATRGNRGRSSRDDRDDRGRDRSRSSGGRDRGRNTGLGYSQSRPPAGRGERDDRRDRDRGNDRMAGGFGSNRDKPREAARNSEREQSTEQRSRSPLARAPRTEERPVNNDRLQRHELPPVEDDVIDLNTGPDFTKARPFDDFWDNGENWQLAHVSKWTPTWTPKAQFCRTYDVEHEVRFLVKDSNGIVREEFLPMTDELNSAAHEIKALVRPNEERRTRTGGIDTAGEISLPGSDIDAVDLDKLNSDVEIVRRTLITEMQVNNIHIEKEPAISSTVLDGLVKSTALRIKKGTDIAVVQNMIAEVVPSTGRGTAELEALANIMGNESGLDVLQKRLMVLRGKVDESVLDHLDAHFTAEVNHALTHAWGFGKTKIDSFIDDFSDLLAAITSMRGAGYTAQFIQRTRNIVTSMVIMPGKEGRKEVIDSQDILPEREEDPADYIAYRENALVLLRPSAALSINLVADAFGLVTDEPRVALGTGTGADPELRDALNGLFLAGRKASATGRVFVICDDNVVLELVGMAGARDVVGIRKV